MALIGTVALLVHPSPPRAWAVQCLGTPSTIEGSAGDDVIYGTLRGDVISARGGADTVFALEGDDRACGGEGDDTLHDGYGRDVLDGGPGYDVASLCPDWTGDSWRNVERVVTSSSCRPSSVPEGGR